MQDGEARRDIFKGTGILPQRLNATVKGVVMIMPCTRTGTDILERGVKAVEAAKVHTFVACNMIDHD